MQNFRKGCKITRRLITSLVFSALVLPQVPTQVMGGPFAPTRLKMAMRVGGTPVMRRSWSTGVHLLLPFQNRRGGEHVFTDTRLILGLQLETYAIDGPQPLASRALRARPGVQLSIGFSGRADSIRLNGLPLRRPTAFSAGADSPNHEQAQKKKHKNRKWWWIGGGVAVVGLLALAGTSIGDREPFQFTLPDDQQ